MSHKKTIAYEYLFNYFGGDTYECKVITGASILLAIKVYKDGKEVKFETEPKHNNTYLCDIFKVSFDKENVFNVVRNLKADNLFRLVYGFDKIEYEIIDYSFSYLSSMPDELKKDMPKEVRDMPYSEVMEVSEEIFKQFLLSHKDDFDITDNKNAQVPAFTFI